MKRISLLLLTLVTVFVANAENIPFGKGTLKVTALTPTALRIQYEEQVLPELPEWIYVSKESFTLKKKVVKGATTLTTTAGVVLIADGQTVTIQDKQGKTIFCATAHSLQASTVSDRPTYKAALQIESPADEFIFGLGQFQDGYTNLRGLSRRLTQVNTQISIPMFLSNKGYGVLWNNYGLTEFNPSDQSVALTRQEGEGTREVVNVTSTTGGKSEVRVRNVFKGQISVPTKGRYSLLLDVGQTMARRHNLSIDGNLLVDHRNLWLPPTTSVLCDLEAGTHTLEAELERGDKPVVYYQPISNQTVLRSPVANAVDYTVFVGSADEIIASYRHVTGDAPMMPKWALGYIHCRERFHSSDEIIQTAQRFRDEQIPLDLIVQDWQWWGKYGWNAMQFDEDHYPDPRKLVETLHGMDVRLMLSVWSKIDKNSSLGRSVQEKGYYIPGTDWIDFFNPDAAAYYWQNFSDRLLKPYGIDAWWQDATEPENDDLKGRNVWNGKYPGEVFRNVYPLLVNKTVFEGSRRDAPERRAMILTRCGFPGIQRYGAAMWTGDVGNDFETLRIQIASGLGMQAAGLPWWTFDAGGFFRPGDQYTNQDYIERMLRWIETSVYAPLMRVHGYMSDTEPWRYGKEAQEIFTQCIRERYRLLPYIYSNAADVSLKGGTLMRPFVFDFPNDNEALAQQNEYMFGHSLLINPVTEAGVSTWKTYLPQHKAGWYDYATGTHYSGSLSVNAPVTLATIPVFVKAGSILPIGSDRQSTADQVEGLMTLRVYPGADAEFTLYEDEGTNYNYEQGKFATIRMAWNDAKRTLTLDARQGSFEGMLKERTFVVQMLNGATTTVTYSGKKVTVKL
ncbi:MAG: DUF5110 domain-containing protein [Bacteroidaceae bacterium]|nr:DUF5110 domain-containing protein [Bacteroidaceae bacterium]